MLRRFFLGASIGAFTLLVFVLLGFLGWLQHLYTSFTTDSWGFLIAGAIFFPIGVIHGWGIWLRIW